MQLISHFPEVTGSCGGCTEQKDAFLEQLLLSSPTSLYIHKINSPNPLINSVNTPGSLSIKHHSSDMFDGLGWTGRLQLCAKLQNRLWVMNFAAGATGRLLLLLLYKVYCN